MLKTKLPIYLASQSPRRKQLLKQIGIKFKSFSVDLDEIISDDETPIAAVKRLSFEKLELAEKTKSDGILITADTIVVLNKNIIGKPKNNKDAVSILSELSNNTHFVYTGYAIKNSVTKKIIIDYEKTSVTFRELSKKEIKDYVAEGSPMDKAGAYGIQDDYGAVFVSKINGCYYNVVGLPLSKVFESLNKVIWLSDKIKNNIFISIIITVIVYLALSFYGNVNLVFESLQEYKWKFFPIILLVFYFTFLLKFIKWQYYLKFLDVKVQFTISFKIFMASLVMCVTPGKIGDLIKSYMLKEVNGTPVNISIPIVFAERVTEFVALLILVILGVNIYNQNILILSISLLSIIILFIILFNSRIANRVISKLSKSKKLEKYKEPLSLTLSNSKSLLQPKPFLLMVLFSLFIWIVESFGFYFILAQFNIDISIIWTFFAYLFSMFIGSVSMLPAGLGVTDGSLTYLLTQNGLSKEIAVSATLIVRIATLWFALIIGIIGMFGFNKISKNKTKK